MLRHKILRSLGTHDASNECPAPHNDREKLFAITLFFTHFIQFFGKEPQLMPIVYVIASRHRQQDLYNRSPQVVPEIRSGDFPKYQENISHYSL